MIVSKWSGSKFCNRTDDKQRYSFISVFWRRRRSFINLLSNFLCHLIEHIRYDETANWICSPMQNNDIFFPYKCSLFQFIVLFLSISLLSAEESVSIFYDIMLRLSFIFKLIYNCGYVAQLIWEIKTPLQNISVIYYNKRTLSFVLYSFI